MDPNEIERLYQNKYRPIVKTLYRYPNVKFILYYSGTLLSWIKKNHSEFIDVLEEMAKRKQIELIGGAFHEPILPLIQRSDRIGQIEMMTTFLRKEFGRRPRGAWVTEQIWEPTLPSTFKSAGIEYVFLSDYHFSKAGFESKDMFSPCITEDQGKSLIVFPIANQMVSELMQRPIHEMIDKVLKQGQKQPDQIVSLVMDHVREELLDLRSPIQDFPLEEWFETFVSEISAAQDARKIQTMVPAKYLRNSLQRSRGYFPPTSYEEMISWAQNGQGEKEFNRYKKISVPGVGRTGFFYGGFVRQAIARYPEGNQMYGKMQYIHSMVNQIRGDRYRKQAAREALWKGQSNVPYWHGPSAGIYQNKLRKQVYRSLIEAEKHTREKGIFAPAIVKNDIDMDGLDECLFQGADLNAYIHLKGGMLTELDYLTVPNNYLDTFSRYPEVYHGPEQEAHGYDYYQRKGFVDHFISEHTQIDDFASMRFEEGAQFYSQVYDIVHTNPSKSKALTLDLVTQGIITHNINKRTREKRKIEIRKQYRLERNTLKVIYTLINQDVFSIETVFAPEINVSFCSEAVSDLRVYEIINRSTKQEIGPETQVLDDVYGVWYEDLLNKVRIQVLRGNSGKIWSYPVYTFHREKKEFVKAYQGSCTIMHVPINLSPNQEMSVEFQIKFARLKSS
jgi:hypothetical protein